MKDANNSAAVKQCKYFTVRNMAIIAVMAELVCVAAPFAVPMPRLVLISLATFAVYLAGGILGAKKGTIAVLIYLLLGAVGLPVFSGGNDSRHSSLLCIRYGVVHHRKGRNS